MSPILHLDDFQPFIGSTFRVAYPDYSEDLTLAEVIPAGPPGALAFARHSTCCWMEIIPK